MILYKAFLYAVLHTEHALHVLMTVSQEILFDQDGELELMHGLASEVDAASVCNEQIKEHLRSQGDGQRLHSR